MKKHFVCEKHFFGEKSPGQNAHSSTPSGWKMARKGDLPKKTADLRLWRVKTNKITPIEPPVEWNSLLGEGKKWNSRGEEGTLQPILPLCRSRPMIRALGIGFFVAGPWIPLSALPARPDSRLDSRWRAAICGISCHRFSLQCLSGRVSFSGWGS